MKGIFPTGIQIIGTQRSGSNLLRVILDQSPQIASPHPPHILTTFVPLLPLYTIENQLDYQLLLNDVVDFVEANPVPWDGVSLNRESLLEQSEEHSVFELNKLICREAAIQKGADYWCCKSMYNFMYAEDIEKVEPALKYVFLYRDGRDVAVSFKKAIVGEKNSYFLAKQWKRDQEACLDLATRLNENQFFSLNYETLISQPEAIIQRLCEFLNIAYIPTMLDFHTSKESRITANAGEMWANLERPIMANNTGKFLKELSKEDLEIFEFVAGDTLKKLGYPLYSDFNSLSKPSEKDIEGYKLENDELKKQSRLAGSENDLEKRQPQENILKAIKSRTSYSMNILNS